MTSLTKTSNPHSTPLALPIVLAAVLVGWFALILIAGRNGVFEAGHDRPPLPILIALVLPPALFALLYRISERVRAFALSIDLRLLTAMQAWRVGGILFLVLYAFGLLPGFSAWPAGLGDFAVGIAAPFVLQAQIAQREGWERRVYWLNIAGLADFVGAVGTSVLSSNSVLGLFASGAPSASMGLLPLSIIPTFAVPLWIIFHMISLIQLRQAQRR
jgi:hypothetical protein